MRNRWITLCCFSACCGLGQSPGSEGTASVAGACQTLLASPPRPDKWEELDRGARFEACLRSELLEPGIAPTPLSVGQLQALGRTSALFCPAGPSAQPLSAPCWPQRCPELDAVFQAEPPAEGGPRYSFRRGVPPGDGEPPAPCLEDGTVEVLGASAGGGLVLRVEWTAVRGNWARCWMGIVRAEDGRMETGWVSAVWGCG